MFSNEFNYVDFNDVLDTNPCTDPYIYNPHSDTCFRLIDSNKNWNDAKNYCESQGEYLVTFSTAAASQWLRAKREELLLENSGMLLSFFYFLYSFKFL